MINVSYAGVGWLMGAGVEVAVGTKFSYDGRAAPFNLSADRRHRTSLPIGPGRFLA